MKYSILTQNLKQDYLKRLLFQSNLFFYRVYDADEKVLIFSSNSFDNALKFSDVLNKIKQHSLKVETTLSDFSDYIIIPIIMPNINSGNLMLMSVNSNSEEVLSLRDIISSSISKDIIGAIELIRDTKIIENVVDEIHKKYNNLLNETTTEKNQNPNIIDQIKMALLNNANMLLQHPETIYSMRGFKIWKGSDFAQAELSFSIDIIGIALVKLNKKNETNNANKTSQYTLVGNEENSSRLKTIDWSTIDLDTLQYLYPFLLTHIKNDSLPIDEKLKITKNLYRLIGQYVITTSIILPILYIQRLKQLGLKFSTYTFFKFEDYIQDQWIQNYVPVMYIHSFGESLNFNSNSSALQPFGIPKQFTIQSNLSELTYGIMRIMDEINLSFFGLNVEDKIFTNKDLKELMQRLGGPSYFPRLLENPLRRDTTTLESLNPTNIAFAFNRGNMNELLEKKQAMSSNIILSSTKLIDCYETINEEFKNAIKQANYIKGDSSNGETQLRKDTMAVLDALNFIEQFWEAYEKTISNSLVNNSSLAEIKAINSSFWQPIQKSPLMYTQINNLINGPKGWKTNIDKYKDIYTLLFSDYPNNPSTYNTGKGGGSTRSFVLWNFILMQLLLFIPILSPLTIDDFDNIITNISSSILTAFIREIYRYIHTNLANTIPRSLSQKKWQITSFYRDINQQIKLCNNTNTKMYAATPFCSPHNYLLAIDIIIEGGHSLANQYLFKLLSGDPDYILGRNKLVNLIKIQLEKLPSTSPFRDLTKMWFDDTNIKFPYYDISNHGTFGFFWLTKFPEGKIAEPWHFSITNKLIRDFPIHKYFCSKAKECNKT